MIRLISLLRICVNVNVNSLLIMKPRDGRVDFLNIYIKGKIRLFIFFIYFQ